MKVNETQWRVTKYEYDTLRRLIRTRVDPAGKNLVTDWTIEGALRADGQPNVVADPRGYRTRYRYDAAGRVDTVARFVAPNTSTGNAYDTAYFYDGNGWLDHVDVPIDGRDGVLLSPPKTRRSKYLRDVLGRGTQSRGGLAVGTNDVDTAESELTGWQYNRLGEVVKTTGKDGRYERYVYDLRGQLSQTVRGYDDLVGGASDGPALADRTTTYVYDNAGRLDRVTPADGRAGDYSQQRDLWGRPEKIVETPDGAVTSL